MKRPSQRRDLFALLSILLLDNFLLYAHASTDFDCRLSVNDVNFDLTTLAGEQIVNRTRSTPPTTMIDSLRFDLCADLKTIDGLAEHDQCPPGTRACLTKVNQKENEPDRITAVIPIAQTSSLDLNSSISHNPKSLSLQLHGATYSGSSTPQWLNLTLFCDPDKISTPEFVAYDGTRLDVAWHAPAACALAPPPKEDNDGDKKGDEPAPPETGSVGSGIGWFFLVILLALLAYFGLGAYYNYSTYGASGIDLIPHRDFWREVPYMLGDVISHLCSSGRPRRASRGGYIAV
jgi:hypothetical protein